MISESKMRGALGAINGVLVVARFMAHSNESVGDVLDVAEYLPALMLAPTDQTDAFRDQLVGLAARYPMAQLALERFDSER